MRSIALGVNPSYTNNAFSHGARSFKASARNAFHTITKKIKNAAKSSIGQITIGFGLGLGAHKIYGPPTNKVIKFLGASAILRDPFSGLNLSSKILLAPFICILAPLIEEKCFRGDLQGMLKNKLRSFYENRGFSNLIAHNAARVTSVFFASVLFGLSHFTNAIAFWCNPVVFLPQVVAATIMGLIFGIAKECSGKLHMPFGMHIGNNTLAWVLNIKASL